MPVRTRSASLHPPCRRLRDQKKAGRSNWSSGNWSGYAIEGSRGAFSSISARWTVPVARPTSQSTYSSAWIGIDGYSNSDLIQTGTAHDYVDGRAEYYAWWEILPASETRIPHPVRPGDVMAARIARVSRGRWSIALRNVTRGWTFRTVQTYRGPQRSAEWIVEAPQIGGDIATFARITPLPFRRCRVDGRSPGLKLSQRGVMVQGRYIRALPSRPNAAGDGFVVRSVRIRTSES
ncbi:G1 family glutamic endopeptidase [Paenibacillus pasadenensis]|uniref:Peptidase A4 family protein n=1 Tax=Paenibacillus pasadenensis TaxID=217090 RepID=A0A2N5N7J9_9BACL|nr:G1 family glutamic endopeptidase [Paenibacillus pasadenensis]PLT46308.1 hypothetical protein B8V81_4739 [Paenibacillus pasadenensis]QGG56754.1 hypothetical protein GE073_14935 [Paenibacillus sp. B01]